MKKITASILSVMLMLSMVFSSSVFAAEKTSVLDSIMGLFSATTAEDTVGVQYKGHVQNYGDVDWVTGPETLGTEGQSLRLEAFYIELTNAPSDMHIMYRVQVQNVGWMDWVQDGAIAGTTGEGLQVETVEIKLVDDNGDAYPGYSVEYQGHVQNVGDLPADGTWYTDGEQLGTVGDYLRLEALRVQIVATVTDLTAYEAAVDAANALSESSYTADSWAALQTALEENVVTEDNTQAEVDAATQAINDAMDALVEVDASLAATGAYELTVSFAGAVDEDAAEFVVKRGLTSVTVSDIDWNDDSSVATLTLASKIKEGTYNVTVSGVAADDIDLSVETEAEEIAAINWLSTDAVATDEDLLGANATYEVLNQYGEDVTDESIAGNLELASRFDDGEYTVDDGVVWFDLTEGDTSDDPESNFEIGDTWSATLYDDDSAVTAATTLTLVDVATCEEIEIGDVWNEDDETLNLDNQGDEFYLLVTLTDQYGNEITDEDTANQDLKIKTSDDDVLGIPEYNSDSELNDQITTIEVDDEDVLALPLYINGDDGDATITFISKGSGTTASVDLEVEAGQMIDTAVLGTPDETIAGGMTIDIPVDVTDNYGDAVTEVNDLFDDFTDVTISMTEGDIDDYLWVEEDGQIYLEFKTLDVDPDDTQTLRINLTTPTDEYSYKTYKVYENSVPEAIVELDDSVSTALIKNVAAEIDYEDLIVEDQYGNVLDPDDYALEAVSSSTQVVVDDSADPIVLTANQYATATSTTITFSLFDPDGEDPTEELDTLSAKFTIVALTDFASYEVADFGDVYADPANDLDTETYDDDYAVQLKVYGVTSAGKTALLPAGDTYYTVATNGYYLGADDSTGVTLLYGIPDSLDVTGVDDPVYMDTAVTVTINATGETLTANGTTTVDTPDIQTVQVVKDNYDTALQTATLTEVSSVTVAGNELLGIGEIAAGTYGSSEVSVVATDQYGVRSEMDESALTFTFPTSDSLAYDAKATYTIASSDDVVFSANGTQAAVVSYYGNSDNFYATIKGDGVSANKIKVTATTGYGTADTYVAVTDLVLDTQAGSVGTTFTPVVTYNPTNASYQTIVWSDLGTGTATVTSVDSSTGAIDVTTAGTVNVRATIANGAAVGTAYTEDFTITFALPASDISFASATSSSVYGDAAATNTLTTTAGDGTITYVSSNTDVVTVDSSTGVITVVGAGSATITATISATTNYSSDSDSYTYTVEKATPVLSGAFGAMTGTTDSALSTVVLDEGTMGATVPGTFAWTDGTTTLTGGTASYSVTFTPTDTTNYNVVTTTAAVTAS